jgi:hypothetical protein
MASASSSVRLPVNAETVWQLIGGFGTLPDWLPYIPSSEPGEGGRTRTLRNPHGDTIIERLVAFDEDERSYTYAIITSPFPVADYRSTIRVVAASDGGSTVEWSGEFRPDGVTDTQVTELFQGIYDDGLAALVEHYSDAPAAKH